MKGCTVPIKLAIISGAKNCRKYSCDFGKLCSQSSRWTGYVAHYWDLGIIAVSVVPSAAVDNRSYDRKFVREKPFFSRNSKLFRDTIL